MRVLRFLNICVSSCFSFLCWMIAIISWLPKPWFTVKDLMISRFLWMKLVINLHFPLFVCLSVCLSVCLFVCFVFLLLALLCLEWVFQCLGRTPTKSSIHFWSYHPNSHPRRHPGSPMQCSLPSGRKMHGAASLAPFAPLLVIYGGWKTGGPFGPLSLILLRQFGIIELRYFATFV